MAIGNSGGYFLFTVSVISGLTWNPFLSSRACRGVSLKKFKTHKKATLLQQVIWIDIFEAGVHCTIICTV